MTVPSFLERRAKICSTLANLLEDLECEMMHATRAYFLGTPQSILEVYTAYFELAEGPSGVAIPQYFLDVPPKESDPVLLVEGDHTVLIEAVKLEEMSSKIRSLR